MPTPKFTPKPGMLVVWTHPTPRSLAHGPDTIMPGDTALIQEVLMKDGRQVQVLLHWSGTISKWNFIGSGDLAEAGGRWALVEDGAPNV